MNWLDVIVMQIYNTSSNYLQAQWKYLDLVQ